MHNAIISDTSCFIILANIDELELLQKVYGHILTTIEIAQEYGEKLPEWVEVVLVKDKYRQQLLEMQIDIGESSAIALALETPNSTVVLDDYKARKISDQLGLSFTGTIGIIIKAKIKGIIPSIKPILQKMRQTDFRLSAEIELQALNEAGE
jgi:predicted nucleic acid-binding protein